MPASRQARAIRTAISPRLAISIFRIWRIVFNSVESGRLSINRWHHPDCRMEVMLCR
jgi:hypothetical protein